MLSWSLRWELMGKGPQLLTEAQLVLASGHLGVAWVTVDEGNNDSSVL